MASQPEISQQQLRLEQQLQDMERKAGGDEDYELIEQLAKHHKVRPPWHPDFHQPVGGQDRPQQGLMKLGGPDNDQRHDMMLLDLQMQDRGLNRGWGNNQFIDPGDPQGAMRSNSIMAPNALERDQGVQPNALSRQYRRQ